VSGVADIVTLGGLVKQYEVRPDLGRLRDYRLTLAQLSQAIQRGNANAGGSYGEQGRQQYRIRGIGQVTGPGDTRDAGGAEHGGPPILVQDVARVAIGAVPRQGIAGQDAEDDIVTGVVLMRRGENPAEVLKAVRARVDHLNATELPPGVKVVPIYDRTWLIRRTLTTVFSNLVEGALLVSGVLWLFLGNLRAAAIVAVAVPPALLSTFLGLTAIGIPANLLSLGAMDFGIIVDGAVIMVENVFRKLSAASHGGAPLGNERRKRVTLEAANEVGRPTLFSMLIIIAAHIPIFTLQRHEGRIFAPMAYSVVSALVGALVLSLTLVPLLCVVALRRNLPDKDSLIVRAARVVYEPSLAWALRRRFALIGVAGVALAVGLTLVPRLGTEFLPELNEGAVWINVTLPTSVSVSEAQELTGRIRAAIRAVPEVASVTSKAGPPEDGTDPK